MKHISRRLLALLLAAAGLAIWDITAPQATGEVRAAAPAIRLALPPLSQPRPGPRREAAPPSQGPPPRTRPASPFRPLDFPAFGPNYRANTDTQSPNLA